MHANRNSTKYLLAALFWLIGAFFLVAGIWNLGSCLAQGAPITSGVLALFFLLLFATVAIGYGRFLFIHARASDSHGETQNIFARVSIVKVIGLLAYGIVPLLFVYFSAESRTVNSQREAAFQKLRPAVMQYIADHGEAPPTLQQLIPDYLPELPAAILLDDNARPMQRMHYVATRKAVRIYYKKAGWLESQAYYDIVDNRYSPAR
ncbi:MAG: hypothetical protein A2521_16645 [Deltaproteobacteria bacterium RIFOXYD12_FULL_57_12]|nr:MAG: hypothetical protein A2521_16645 [Deltaproteobacteria bacterium RIFOXYD12_FULL_57_12]